MVSLDELITGGSVLPITRWGTPVMHAPTTPVTTFDEDLHTLIRDMFATMAAAQGVGLAATQVGQGISLFIFDCPDEDEVRHYGVICNPVVTTPDGRNRHLDAAEEGCLSLPGAYETLARPDHAICEGVDHNGEPVKVVGTGLLARCLQHETDHLNGTVFGDRLASKARKRLYAQHDSVADRYLADWPVSPKQPAPPQD
ncbi:peptide deformylase [Granulicoccus phenolivorans]|uniref:peptide deformylase n=1 Tax=Granulicoccus phenolivorans TaxID=266854 RepID=UPI0003FAF88C|nr:peptide deformylase [Granulicoccus phenolivorans]